MKTRVYISDINLALSSDEIIEIEKCYIGRNNHHRSFKIKGKIFTGLTDEQIEISDILLMAKQKNEDYFPEKTREMLQEIYSNLDINDMEKNLKERVYEYNRENIRKITRWSNSPKDCYHRLIIETIFEEEAPEFLIIPLVFVKKFDINISSEKGVGEFELLLYEKFVLNETSFKIYMGDKKDFRSISQNNMVIQNKKFENSYIYDENNKESTDIEVITDNKIEDDEIEICLFDVNDEHVNFLLGKQDKTFTLLKKMKKEDIKKVKILNDIFSSKNMLIVCNEQEIKSLFLNQKRELTVTELEEIENVKIEYPIIETSIVNSYNPNLILDVINILCSKLFFGNILNQTINYKFTNKLLKSFKKVEENYFLYKLYYKENKYMLIGMSRNVHYERNKYQEGKVPIIETQLENIFSNTSLLNKFIEKFGINTEPLDSIYYFCEKNTYFKKLEKDKSIYHGLDNNKYVNLDKNRYLSELYEVVFDKNGCLVTSAEKRGTFNFYGPSKIRAHVMFDMLPYWLWGNSENDTTIFIDRLYPIRENFKPLLESKEALNIMNGIFIYR